MSLEKYYLMRVMYVSRIEIAVLARQFGYAHRFAAPLTARPATFNATRRGEIGGSVVSAALRIQSPNYLPPSRTIKASAAADTPHPRTLT